MKFERQEGDYAQYLIRLMKSVRKINDAINDKEFDLAKMLAHDIRITAIYLDTSLDKLK